MQNIFELVNKQRVADPHKVAIVYEGQEVSYAKLIQETLKLSQGLKSLGLGKGQRIALFAPNGIEYAIVLLAAAKLGVAVVPLPITLKGMALINALKKVPVACTIAWSSVSSALLESNVIEPGRLITLNKKVGDELEWRAFLDAQQNDDESFEGGGSDPYILTMTSGSTGEPKPIVLSQQCKIARAFEATVNYYSLSKTDVVLVSTPLYHSLAERGLLMPLMLGATTVIMPKFNIKKWFDLITNYGVTFMFSVSSQLESLIPELQKGHDLSSLKCIVSSSAVLPSETKDRLLQHLDCRLHECYGASEVGVVTDFCVSEDRHKRGSVGKPLPFVSLKIVDKDGLQVAPSEVGEIVCTTSTAFNGYHKLPEQTKKAYDKDGYFSTGDLGYLDDDGYLYYVGRNKEVISTGGINVYPQDIESVIKTHPHIADCVAFGIPDQKFGEVVKVVYVSNEADSVIDEMEIRKLCFEQLTDYQQPRELLQVPCLERSGLGKILRNEVKLKYKH
ncbi:hypothetical protein N474_14115 [Pseudoalteromonas luteoviolacea CPMOR-2]|uniref:class I adenylate-forming enzyme family protein n=1 Tax=Pseudoalteromonas luteoviolacea TaxID=43657 RepID=UPI0007B0B15D|nr:class I adenylate-forming enzyme family protein [Pseudoalteromonas luteoviolacea]KZN55678.1 hypothetical protein N474_14115 [Pseudoalteromonas luteoviolacea CPMOR-2]